MDELDDCGEIMMVPPRVAAGTGRKNEQRRSQTLAAAADDVIGDLADQHDFRMQTVPNDFIHGVQIVGNESPERFYRHGSYEKGAMIQ